MSRMVRELARVLEASAADRGVTLTAHLLQSRAWSSALFSGERLTFDLAADDDEAFEAWLATLPETELPLHRYFVADADMTARGTGAATVELLVIEEV
jgi:hypothetical protein